MSSHHIVREKQEPALLILDLAHFNGELLGQILEWSPAVFATNSSYEEINSLGIKVDFVFAPESNLDVQEHTKIIVCSGDILEGALKYLVTEEYPAVNIITNSFYLKDYVLFVDLIDLVVFVGSRKIFPVRSGFSKWQVANKEISLMHPVNVNTFGLWELESQVFKTEKDGFYGFTFEQPSVFISEEIS